MSEFDYEILAIGAHPDDVEVGCGGVMIDAVKRDHKCGIVVMTKGEMGTGGSVEIREAELKDAADIMGVDISATFDWGDTKLEDNYSHRLELAKVIRKTKPRIILAPHPQVGHGRRQSHVDHIACGNIAINASNLASLKKADVEGEIHLTERIFHYFLPPGMYPSFIVDITPHFDQWIKALSAHKSQFLNPEKSRGYIESLTRMARNFGAIGRCEYGQGFGTIEALSVDSILNLTKR